LPSDLFVGLELKHRPDGAGLTWPPKMYSWFYMLCVEALKIIAEIDEPSQSLGNWQR
jgi:hypothetical protein